MSIKKLITGLTLSLLLASPVANADWGDVYYCQMTNFFEITLKGENRSYELERFQFKLDQTKNAMVFGSTGFFSRSEMELVKDSNWPSLEVWSADDEYSMAHFSTGKFLYAQIGFASSTTASADCEKF